MVSLTHKIKKIVVLLLQLTELLKKMNNTLISF